MHKPNDPMRQKEFLTIELLNVSKKDQIEEEYKCNIRLSYCNWNSLNLGSEDDEIQFKIEFGNNENCDITFGSTYQELLGPKLPEDWEESFDLSEYEENWHILNFLRNSQIGRRGIQLQKMDKNDLLNKCDDSLSLPIPKGIFKGDFFLDQGLSKKKIDTLKNCLLVKIPQFSSDPHET